MRLVNQTRYSPSIPRRLVREGRLHLLPAYYVVRLSDLAAEGIEHSGSHRFADHIYLGQASGRWLIGKLVDRLLLSLPATRSFRNRFFHTRDEILRRLQNSDGPRRVLSVPSGIPRDLIEVAQALRTRGADQFQNVTFYCLDADPTVLAEARAAVANCGLHNFQFLEADAFDEQSYPGELDLITSTGFTEFLDDENVASFYEICFQRLRNGGVLVTSATVRNRLSDYMLRNLAELRAYYRDEGSLRELFAQTPFGKVHFDRDSVGYQILITAEKLS